MSAGSIYLFQFFFSPACSPGIMRKGNLNKNQFFRNSKLPVGVDCTLSLIQVSLRDREWSEKLDKAELPMYYENDLCMMYSLCIMRFLNHISNIGHTKQTSLFQIAKQIKIPDWIVNLRHDAAHGYELPSVGVLRIAVNILLAWLHVSLRYSKYIALMLLLF